MQVLCSLTSLLWVLAKWLQSKSAKLLVARLSPLAEVARGRAAGQHMLVALMARGKTAGAPGLVALVSLQPHEACHHSPASRGAHAGAGTCNAPPAAHNTGHSSH